MTRGPLLHALQSASFHAFLIIIQQALACSGFDDVKILDRRVSRQKSRFGGHEIECRTTIGTESARVLVKVIQDSARIRMLDELCGAVGRRGAQLGLLITPFHVVEAATKLREKYADMQVRWWDGPTLVQVLQKYGIGTRPNGSVDYAYFGELENAAPRIVAFFNELSHESR